MEAAASWSASPGVCCRVSARCKETCSSSDSWLYTGVTGRGTARSITASASAGGIGSALASSFVCVQRRPGRILSGDARTVDHLLRLQQILDQEICLVELIAVGVDRER